VKVLEKIDSAPGFADLHAPLQREEDRDEKLGRLAATDPLAAPSLKAIQALRRRPDLRCGGAGTRRSDAPTADERPEISVEAIEMVDFAPGFADLHAPLQRAKGQGEASGRLAAANAPPPGRLAPARKLDVRQTWQPPSARIFQCRRLEKI
jgi:hypothetical protein